MIEAGKVILMMSDANREIRIAEQEASDRRREITARAAVHRLDWLIAQLEEMNLADMDEVPESFLADVAQVCNAFPRSWLESGWPTSVTAALDRCFELQERLFSGALNRHVA